MRPNISAAANRCELPLAARQILIPHRLHADARERLAELVRDTSRDDAAARQREVDPLDDLRIADVERAPAFEWPPLSELQRDVSASRDEDVVAARGKIGEFIATLGVGVDASIDAQLGRRDSHLRAAQGSAVVCGDHAAANARGTRRDFGGAVARRHLHARTGWAGLGRALGNGWSLPCSEEGEEKNRRRPEHQGMRSHTTSGLEG